MALALVITLVLGGASVARALSVPPLDAKTDLEFSLNGADWTDEPALVLGEWGCDLAGEPVIPDPGGAIGGTTGVDPCAMSPGEYIDRTYFVRNSTNTGRVGMYEVGVGEFELSVLAEFDVSSKITGDGDGGSAGDGGPGEPGTGTGPGTGPGAPTDPADPGTGPGDPADPGTITGPGDPADPGTITLYGPGTAQADQTPAPETRLAAVQLAPGAWAKVVDTVSIPATPENYEQDQSVSPRIWVSFSDIGDVDTDRDGLPNNIEGEIGTDPHDPYNPLPDGTVGQRYGPQNFLPTTPDGATVVVDASTLPPGVTLENGVLGGRPSSVGTYDVEFTITMPGGAEYTSLRRIVIHPRGGGSSELPDIFWPIIVGGVIGVIVGIIASGPGSSTGSVGGSAGGSTGGLIGSTEGSGSAPGSGAGTVGRDGTNGGDGTDGRTDGGATDGSGPGIASTVDGVTGQVPVETVTPREGSPSDEWARANSEVRSSLPTTGVGVADLLLWALTAVAAGATLILFARRRSARGSED